MVIKDYLVGLVDMCDYDANIGLTGLQVIRAYSSDSICVVCVAPSSAVHYWPKASKWSLTAQQ
jgi:hypothetical protein